LIEPKAKSDVSPSKVLVIPFANGIGDFVNMQPLLSAILTHYPYTEIQIAASNYANYLLPTQSPIKVVTPSWFDREPTPTMQRFRPLISQKILGWLAAPILKREIKQDFDLTINTFYLWEREMDFQKFWTPQVPPREGARHTLDCLADVIQNEFGIGVPSAERYPRLYVRESARVWARDFFARYELAARPVVAMVAESNMLIKKWNARAWVNLGERLQTEGYTPLFFVVPNSPIIKEINSLGQKPPLIVSETLDKVTALLQLCQLCIGVDTGLLHIASAVGTAWLGLFGPTNPDVTGPYDRRIGRALTAQFPKPESCRSCWKNFKYEYDECRTLEKGSCIDLLDEKLVAQVALQMLTQARV
jgi:ADP-heptose:LPS heptosyltransferase